MDKNKSAEEKIHSIIKTLLEQRNECDLNGFPVCKVIEQENKSLSSYLRADAVIKAFNSLSFSELTKQQEANAELQKHIDGLEYNLSKYAKTVDARNSKIKELSQAKNQLEKQSADLVEALEKIRDNVDGKNDDMSSETIADLALKSHKSNKK